jgi:hypothetical protein
MNSEPTTDESLKMTTWRESTKSNGTNAYTQSPYRERGALDYRLAARRIRNSPHPKAKVFKKEIVCKRKLKEGGSLKGHRIATIKEISP